MSPLTEIIFYNLIAKPIIKLNDKSTFAVYKGTLNEVS